MHVVAQPQVASAQFGIQGSGLDVLGSGVPVFTKRRLNVATQPQVASVGIGIPGSNPSLGSRVWDSGIQDSNSSFGFRVGD